MMKYNGRNGKCQLKMVSEQMDMFDEGFLRAKLSGTMMAYYIVCKRKLWLFANHITMEKESDLVEIGKLISETTFKREKNKEMLIGDTLKIDFLKIGDRIVVHEVKKSRKLEEAHIWQVKFYIYSLKSLGVQCDSGVIHYPKLMRKIDVEFTDEDCKKIEKISQEINILLNGQLPPLIKKAYCKKCAYYNFCYL